MAPLALRRATALLLVGGLVPAYGERAGVEQLVFATRHFEKRDHAEQKEVREATAASGARRANASAAGQGRAATSSGSGLDTCVPWETFSKFTLCTGDMEGNALAQLAAVGHRRKPPPGPPANRSLLEEGADRTPSIPGSSWWWSCDHPGMQKCGYNSCCCFAGMVYNNDKKNKACFDPPRAKDGGAKCCKCKDGYAAYSRSGACSPCDGEVIEPRLPVPAGCDPDDKNFLGSDKCAKMCGAVVAAGAPKEDKSGALVNAECEGCKENLGYFRTWLKDSGETFHAPTCGCLACGRGLKVCVPWGVFCKYGLGYDPEEEDRPKSQWTLYRLLNAPTEETTWQANLARFKREYGHHGNFPDNCPGPDPGDAVEAQTPSRPQDIQVETPRTYTEEEIASRMWDK